MVSLVQGAALAGALATSNQLPLFPALSKPRAGYLQRCLHPLGGGSFGNDGLNEAASGASLVDGRVTAALFIGWLCWLL